MTDNRLRGPSVAVLPPHSRPASNHRLSRSSDPSSVADAEGASSFAESLTVLIEGKPALLCYDHEFFFVVRGRSRSALSDPSKAYLRVPLALVLHTSFVSDSDGGSLLVRLLSPPLQGAASSGSYFPLPFGKKAKASPTCMESLSEEEFEGLSSRQRSQRLQQQLEGPCSNLRLFRIEARVVSTSHDEEDVEAKAEGWVEEVMSKAYGNVKPFRRIKVLINPVGGPGKARQLYESRVRPIFDAAMCKPNVTFTQYRMHGVEIARDLDVENYDAIAIMSGDGLIHEVLNGFAKRSDAKKALRLPLAPIPAGSGNAAAINLMGLEQGFSLALACLNIIKGRAMAADLLTVTQPASAFPPGTPIPGTLAQRHKTKVESGSSNGPTRASEDAALIADTPAKPFVRYYSFLSQAIGLMADVDLGTESMRALGDTRFLIGYAAGVLKNAECEVDVDVKLGLRGSKNKAEMRERVRKFHTEGNPGAVADGQTTPPNADGNGAASQGSPGSGNALEQEDEDSATEWARDAFGNLRFQPEAEPPLRHGVVTDALAADEAPPPFDLTDPSWPHSIASKVRSARRRAQSSSSSGGASNGSNGNGDGDDAVGDQMLGWYRIQEPLASFYGGKLPWLGRDLMQFPYALPGDGAIDVAMMMHGGGRISKLPEGDSAQNGQLVYQKAMAYLKVEAYRVTPRLKEGDKRLKKGGMCSIDGEKVPYAPFQVEVAHGLTYSVLSLYGRYCVPVVEPPKVK
ncbi:sphinganine kinase lcb4 [Thecaphora frezii]